MVSCEFSKSTYAGILTKVTILSAFVILFVSEWLNDIKASIQAITVTDLLAVLMTIVSLAIVLMLIVFIASKNIYQDTKIM